MEDSTTKTNTKKFSFVEETQITKQGKQTFWYTRELVGDFNSMVTDSLSFTKDEAQTMFHLIVENGGVMKSERVLKTIEVVVK